MLAHVVALKTNIVITGSHGKTTTTSLISNILSKAKFDPTIINGGIINSFNGNARLGKGNWAVLEADESDGSFLNFPINYSVVTNIDREHMDFYKNFKNLKNAFLKFLNKTPLDENCEIRKLNKYSKSYLNHLIKCNEIMASMLISLHNIYFYQQFMREIRKNIKDGTFSNFYKKYIKLFN